MIATTLLRHGPARAKAVDSLQAEQVLHHALRRRGLELRCRSAELAGALRRFRERQVEINSGGQVTMITMPAVASAAWLAAA